MTIFTNSKEGVLMSFNFKKAIQHSVEDTKNPYLSAIVLGPSGAGKSYLMGTFGVKTLYLYTGGESHGPRNAMIEGKDNIIPISYDRDSETNKLLDSDDTYNQLLEILKSKEMLKELGVGAIALDGASELEVVIRNSKGLYKRCLNDKGKFIAWDIGPNTIAMFRSVLNVVRDLQRELKVHFAMTGLLDVKSYGKGGAILESCPRLQGYGVCENLIQQHGDVLVVGRMNKGEVVKHKIQMMASVVKSATDEIGTITRSVNFNPRVEHFAYGELGDLLDADLSKLAKTKKEKVNG